MHRLGLSVALAISLPTGSIAGPPTPDGAYLSSRYDGGRLSSVIFVFKDGKVASHVGDAELERFDFSAHRAQQPKNFGTYTTSGEQFNIDWSDGTRWEGRLRPDKFGGFDWRSAAYAPIRPIPRGATLEGRFSGGASVAGAAVGFNYTFSPNGSYTALVGGDMVSRSPQATATAGASKSTSGTYSLSGNTLTLKPAGSPARSHRIYYVPTRGGETKPEMIIVDGVVATRM